MSANKKTRSNESQLTGFERIEKFHPYRTFLFFALIGSTILFLSMAFLYSVTISRGGIPEGFQMPKAFSVSTILLLISSYTVSGCTRAFRDDSFIRLKIALVGTLLLGIAFSVSQVIGWMQLANAGFFVKSNIGVDYLYMITGMHFIHMAGGLVYISALTYSVFIKSRNLAHSLLFLTDQYQFTRLQLASVYWHFVDALWVLLFLMFLFSF